MIPSLVAGEVRRGIVEYLTTTFALADDDTRAALTRFLVHGDSGDDEQGIFRGPFLRVRPPFRSVGESWASPLARIPRPKEWEDDGIDPFVHQGRAWERLVGAGGTPQPTILTTGTGSGKTEGFEVPILDHVVWARGTGVSGIKAIILYPMNALVADQAGRFAKRVAGDPRLAGVRVGQFAGGSGSQTTMSADGVIDDYDTMLDDPPDILLTNYKMLDRLLTRANRKRLWDANTPDSLAYLILDEFHTYDGAQGTDVAMLLRRLGARLGLATADRPLGPVVPVATSATLASTPQARQDLLSFAERIFGVPFTPDAVIVEDRLAPDEAVGMPSQFHMPDPAIVAKLDDREPASILEAAKLFFPDADGLFAADGTIDQYRLGELVQGHRLMRPVLTHAGGTPARWDRIAERIAQTDGQWEAHHLSEPAEVAAAVAWFVALVSHARRYRTTKDAGQTVPKLTANGERVPYELFAVEVQQWVREVSRLLRKVNPDPAFAWRDDGVADEGEWLPSIYCRQCGRSGWASVTTDHPPNVGCVDAKMSRSVAATYQASVTHDTNFRAFISANPAEIGVRWLSAGDGQQWREDDSHDVRVPVLTHTDPTKTKAQACPSCDTDDAIRFLGSAVTSLASVTVSQLFGSPMVNPDERKLIAFTDSVQDAAHRAGFFTGRAHRFNLRSLLAGHLIDAGSPVRLADLIDGVLAGADSPENRFNILPPDLHQEPALRSLIDDDPPTAFAAERLETRTRLDVVMDVGLRGRVGRTLETTGSAVVWVDVDDDALAQIIDAVTEHHQLNPPVQQTELDLGDSWTPPDLTAATVWRHWLSGLLIRTRNDGAIAHPWFDPWWLENNAWPIWGGRPVGMPAFPNGIPRPRVPATGGPADGAYDRIGVRSWWENWTARTLGITGRHAVDLVTLALDLLADTPALDRHTVSTGGSSITYFTLNAQSIFIEDLNGATAHREAICDVCSRRDLTPAHQVLDVVGQPCLRFQWPGRYAVEEVAYGNYYRRFYREGVTRRIVAKPHTGQLDHEDRVALELAFKHSDSPDAPNVLAATPTLEMGIDIGDLSATMLTSMPRTQASYAQRIGRSGRKTGNSLITVFTEADPLSLYYLSDPDAMLAGDIRPPDCYLDAVEILQRHLFGFFVDRAADDTLSLGVLPPIAHKLMESWGQPGGWLEEIVSEIETNTGLVTQFLDLFAGHLNPDVRTAVIEYAANRIRDRVNDAVTRWRDEDGEYRRREQRMKTAIDAIAANQTPTDAEQRRLRTLRGERAAIMRARNDRHRSLDSISTLEAFGLLPNYTLNDDTVSFIATLWYYDKDGNYQEIPPISTDRSASMALTELAPGSVFYAGPYRLTVDSLDIGSAAAPLYEQLRTCPSCAYAQPHSTGSTAGPCPRCGNSAFADDGNVHTVLRMRQVMTVQPEQDCRVTDDSDTRTRVAFDVATGVDIDPASIQQAWKHHDAVYAFEYSNAATIRRLNLGRDGRPGPVTTTINGHPHRSGLFEVCTTCGIVAGVRRPDPKSGEERHRGFCKARRGDATERFETLMLGYETVTEAVRILLPVADMDRDERVASFKALLLLGLRLSFGGDPDHLRIITTSYPTSDPEQRQQLLIVHDTVNGGTGYVARLADPEQMRDILTKARDVVSRCPCQADGKPACHLCLLATADRRDIPNISRRDALDIVEPLLADWGCVPLADPITAVDVTDVQQSELEQRFKRLLHKINDLPNGLPDGTRLAVTSTPIRPGRTDFTIRASRPDGTTAADGTPNYTTVSRWTITEQKALLAGSHQTVADFYATRDDDTTSPPIAIYLDGYAFHASPAVNSGPHHRLDDDHIRRDSLRAAGTLVWSATWDDVAAVEKSWRDGQTMPAKSTAWPTQTLSKAEQLFAGTQARHWIASNPILSLIHFLAHPDLVAWHQTTRHLLLGNWMHAGESGGSALPIGDVEVAVDTWLSDGTVIEYAGAPANSVAAPIRTSAGLRFMVAAVNPPGGTVGTAVVLPNTAADMLDEDHPARWRQFLHLSNALQFLSRDGDVGAATTATLAPAPTTTAGPEPAPAPAAAPADGLAVPDGLLDDVLVEEVRDLLEQVAAAGTDISGVQIGEEFGDGIVIEAAFPAPRVGITDPDAAEHVKAAEAAWAATSGWDLRPPERWTVDTLVAALTDPTPQPTTADG